MRAERRPGRPERPLDPGDGALSCFARELRQLRAAAGYPSYRDLSRRARFSASVLSAAASGSSLPSLQVTLAYADACGGDLGDWQRRWQATADLARQAPPRAGAEARFTPAELPPAPACFTGRAAELTWLLALTDPRNRSRAASVVISGPIGIGKTALSLRFARDARHDYPDGQLHADLTACGMRGSSPHHITGMLLGALGIRAPADPQRRAGLYRSVLAARRILVVLDNAGREPAVRPLLAAGGRSLVVMTSRSRLAGLDAVRRVTLDALRPADSQTLLAAVAGPVLGANPGTAGMLGELCGHLPLALWIAATRLAGRGSRAISAAKLLRGAGLLDWLRVGDLSVRQRLESAYYRLDVAARGAFRSFGRTTGDDVDAAQITEHTGVSALAAERLLETLADAGLLQASRTGAGYRAPPLFASFARELQYQPLVPRDTQARGPHRNATRCPPARPAPRRVAGGRSGSRGHRVP